MSDTVIAITSVGAEVIHTETTHCPSYRLESPFTQFHPAVTMTGFVENTITKDSLDLN